MKITTSITVNDQSQIAESLKVAIENEHTDVVEILAKHVDKSACEIKTEDGDAEELSDNYGCSVVSTHRLLIDGIEVAEWTRCANGNYDESGDWSTEEDTNYGDGLPEIVESLLDAIGIDDSIPDVDEPAAHEHPTDADGEYCVYWETVGDDAGPLNRYATQEQAQEMCDVFTRQFEKSNPSGGSTRMLCGHSVREWVDGEWVACDE